MLTNLRLNFKDHKQVKKKKRILNLNIEKRNYDRCM